MVSNGNNTHYFIGPLSRLKQGENLETMKTEGTRAVDLKKSEYFWFCQQCWENENEDEFKDGAC